MGDTTKAMRALRVFTSNSSESESPRKVGVFDRQLMDEDRLVRSHFPRLFDAVVHDRLIDRRLARTRANSCKNPHLSLVDAPQRVQCVAFHEMHRRVTVNRTQTHDLCPNAHALKMTPQQQTPTYSPLFETSEKTCKIQQDHSPAECEGLLAVVEALLIVLLAVHTVRHVQPASPSAHIDFATKHTNAPRVGQRLVELHRALQIALGLGKAIQVNERHRTVAVRCDVSAATSKQNTNNDAHLSADAGFCAHSASMQRFAHANARGKSAICGRSSRQIAHHAYTLPQHRP